MSKIFNFMMNMAEEFKQENPELVEFMESPEEVESFHKDFEDFLDSQKPMKEEISAIHNDLMGKLKE